MSLSVSNPDGGNDKQWFLDGTGKAGWLQARDDGKPDAVRREVATIKKLAEMSFPVVQIIDRPPPQSITMDGNAKPVQATGGGVRRQAKTPPEPTTTPNSPPARSLFSLLTFAASSTRKLKSALSAAELPTSCRYCSSCARVVLAASTSSPPDDVKPSWRVDRCSKRTPRLTEFGPPIIRRQRQRLSSAALSIRMEH